MRAPQLLLSVVLLVLGACSSPAPSPSSAQPPPAVDPSTGGSGSSPGGGNAAPTLAEALRACPVTVGNGSSPPGVPSDRTFFGGDGLWTVLWPHGLVVVPADDIGRNGILGMKFPWWRGPGVRGSLHITGEEIGSGLPIMARTAGYGRTGFNASGLLFPKEGCYRVTARAGAAELTFVTLVRTCEVVRELPPRQRRRYAICTR
jgi:hypothetical protein